MNFLYSFRTKKKKKILESNKKGCDDENFCNKIMPSEDTKILEFNKNKKSDKASFIIYADLECIIKKIDGCQNSPENPSTTKVREHLPSGFSLSTISSFKNLEN